MTIAHPNRFDLATLSECERHRFLLSRTIDASEYLESGRIGQSIGWIMFNPSTADGLTDDATIRKVIGFSQRAGFSDLTVANLFSLRATNPKYVAANLDDACPSTNLEAIDYVLSACSVVVCAWGALAAPRWAQERVRDVVRRAEVAGHSGKLHVIDLSKDGHPVHPLMQAYAKGIQPWFTRLNSTLPPVSLT